MEEPYRYTPKTPEKKPGFFGRMKKGFQKVSEMKEKFDEGRLKAAEKRLERQERYAKVYEAEAKMYGAAARREEARQKFSQLRMGSFGGGSGGINMGLQQPQRTKVVYRPAPRKKARARVRYAAQPQRTYDDDLVDFMRR